MLYISEPDFGHFPQPPSEDRAPTRLAANSLFSNSQIPSLPKKKTILGKQLLTTAILNMSVFSATN
jgi:hypothetical protein